MPGDLAKRLLALKAQRSRTNPARAALDTSTAESSGKVANSGNTDRPAHNPAHDSALDQVEVLSPSTDHISSLLQASTASQVRATNQVASGPLRLESNQASAYPQSWTSVAPWVWQRDFRIKLQIRTAAFPFTKPRFLAFDTETTGLSSGAGTIAFLIGWAFRDETEEEYLQIRQFFIQDYPGEADCLEKVIVTLKSDLAQKHHANVERWLLSWNGGSFDLPLMRSRCIMNGMEWPDIPHRDLLHLGRRLFRSVYGSARMSDLEGPILQRKRTEDLPGALIPDYYQSYIRSGAGDDFMSRLSAVFSHHVEDLISLIAMQEEMDTLLYDCCQAAFRPATAFPHRPYLWDGFGVGRSLLSRTKHLLPNLELVLEELDFALGWAIECHKASMPASAERQRWAVELLRLGGRAWRRDGQSSVPDWLAKKGCISYPDLLGSCMHEAVQTRPETLGQLVWLVSRLSADQTFIDAIMQLLNEQRLLATAEDAQTYFDRLQRRLHKRMQGLE